MTNQPPSIYIGPAQVLAVQADGRPRLRILDAEATVATADWAIPYRYEPANGDLLLVMGRRGRYWVTGIVHGRGRSQLGFRGDIAVHASGSLRLAGDGGVRIKGAETHIWADHLESEAETSVQHFDEVDTTVRERLEERSGECSRIIDGEDQTTAGRHSTTARGAVKVDGDVLLLG